MKRQRMLILEYFDRYMCWCARAEVMHEHKKSTLETTDYYLSSCFSSK